MVLEWVLNLGNLIRAIVSQEDTPRIDLLVFLPDIVSLLPKTEAGIAMKTLDRVMNSFKTSCFLKSN